MNMEGWKIEINNHIGHYGDCYHDTRTIRINIRMHMKYRESIHDTLTHEFLHFKYPDMPEEEVAARTRTYEITYDEWHTLATLYLKALQEWQATHNPPIPVRKRMRRVPHFKSTL